MKEKVTHIKRICANNVVRSSHNNQDNALGFFDAVKIAIAAFALIGSIFGIGQICRLRAEGAAFEAAHPELLAEVAK